jgi:hypothetical protein
MLYRVARLRWSRPASVVWNPPPIDIVGIVEAALSGVGEA